MEVIAVGEADDSEKTLGGEADGLLLSAKSDGACLASEDICGDSVLCGRYCTS